jgi:hypothetical protein
MRPHTKGKGALEEEVRSGFLMLVAKLANSTIWSSSLLKSIRRPNSILNYQPSEGFAFERCPRLPNEGGHAKKK